MAITMDGIFVNGQKATFHPEDILSGDASAYTQEIGTAVEEWLEENVTGGEQVTDTTLTLPGVPADAKMTGDKIDELKEDLSEFITTTDCVFEQNQRYETGYNSNRTWTHAEDSAVAQTGWSSIKYAVLKGDKITLTADSRNSSYRTYILVGTNNHVDYSGMDAQTNVTVTAVADGYIVINNDNSRKTPSCTVVHNTVELDINTISGRVTVIEAELADADLDTVQEVVQTYSDGFNTLKADWERGSWKNTLVSKYTFDYVISTKTGIEIATDMLVKMDLGFRVSGYYTLGGVLTGIRDSRCSVMLPKGSTAYLNITRITQDTTEIADIAEFASKLKIVSMPMSDYWRYKDSIYGIEMFKSLGFVGDSYTAGRDGHSWGETLGRQIGTPVGVYAHSGYTSAKFRTQSDGLATLLADTAKELYWINFGINDGARYQDTPAYLGSDGDLTGDYSNYPDTFWGNMGCIIESIQAHSPNCRIVLEQCCFHNPLSTQKSTDTTDLPVINAEIAKIGTHYGIPVIDMLDDVFYWSQEYMDGMISNHPDILLYPAFANANRRLFAKCVRDNYSYFANWLI